MAFKNLVAFGAGELTPELWERGNLDKFRTGLMTLRNATVTKMGGLKSRSGTLLLNSTKSGVKAKFVYIPAKNYLLEFTTNNIRVYPSFDADENDFGSTADIDITLTEVGTALDKMHFTFGNRYLFVFAEGRATLVLDLDKVFTDPSNSFSILANYIIPKDFWTIGTAYSFTAGTTAPTGYDIDYAVAFVYDGVEIFPNTNNTRKKPILTQEHNVISAVITKASLPAGTPMPDELRVYQRPRDGGGFLYVGNATAVETSTTATYTFKDFGVSPDPTNRPPELVAQFSADAKVGISGFPGTYFYPVKAKTGLVYQDRLVFSGSTLKNRVFGSRTGSAAMTTDFPAQADSAVSFKIGSDGALTINRFFDGRGLLIFTSVGVYETPSELLTPDTAFAIKRAPYVADEIIEPVQLGGFVTIFDRRLKAVIGLTPSGNYNGFAFDEFSIYSAHLLKGRRIVSWAHQEAETSILWMVLDDGSALSFSYQDEQQVRSWARHDFKDGLAEEVFVMDFEDGNDVVCFSINRGGTRYIERLTPRDADFIDYVGSDSTVKYSENILVSIASPTATVAPVTPGVWDGALTITPAFTGFAQVVGDIVRVFTAEFEYVDMEVTANTLGVLTVTPNIEFPSSLANLTSDTNPLWKVYSGELTGLSHLNGKKVCVRIDGFTHASPLNTDKDYNEYTVASGKITLATSYYGSHISVGLPVVTDIQTLEVDTVEQSPTKLEGQIVNRLWLSYFESLFLYAGSNLPTDDTVSGMENQEYQVEEDPDVGITSTIPSLPQSERLEMSIEGDWRVKGSVALRNVDPQPIGLRAIIPDTEVIRN